MSVESNKKSEDSRLRINSTILCAMTWRSKKSILDIRRKRGS